MDDDTPSRRSRLGASTLSAAALLVLTFGPSALALSPSTSASAAHTPPRTVVSAPVAAAAAIQTTRSQDEEDAYGTAAEAASTDSGEA